MGTNCFKTNCFKYKNPRRLDRFEGSIFIIYSLINSPTAYVKEQTSSS